MHLKQSQLPLILHLTKVTLPILRQNFTTFMGVVPSPRMGEQEIFPKNLLKFGTLLNYCKVAEIMRFSKFDFNTNSRVT